MFKNYFLVGIRSLWRQRFYSFINVVGLAIGICCFSLIVLFVNHELTYDKFHDDAERIYRMDFSGRINDSEFITNLMSAPASYTLQNDFPDDIDEAFRFRQTGTYFIRAEETEQNFKESNVLFVDSNAFTFWNLPLKYGNSKAALNEPKTLALSSSMANKLFGDNINPVGKNVILDDETPWKVDAVYEDIPSNSHFNADIFLSMLSRQEAYRPMWLSFNFPTYFKLNQGTDVQSFESKLNKFVPEKYLGPEIKKFMNMDMNEFDAKGNYMGFSLFPLTEIHLKSNKMGELQANGDIQYIYIFSAIGIFILILACINFINLATARSVNRAKEVGLRKVLGAYKSQLVAQFMTEAFLITLSATVLSVFALFLILPVFNEISGKSFVETDLITGQFIVVISLLTMIVALVAGLYPSFYLSKFQPIKTLKGKVSQDLKGGSLRNALVIFQFTISLVLIIGTLTVNNQLTFIQNKKLGYDKERLLLIEDSWILGDQKKIFKNELVKNSNISSGSIANFFPVDLNNNNNVYWPGTSSSPVDNFIVNNHYVDYDFIPTLNVAVKEGRNFSRDFQSDSLGIIINETCAKQMGFENAIGEFISTYTEVDNETKSQAYKVIGVVKDFHFKSLHQVIQPMVLHLSENGSYVCFKLNKNAEMSKTLEDIHAKWEELAPGQPFSYSFIDDRFEKLHASENQIRNIVNIFTIITILIACLGLLGLASYTAAQKTKEIGIRKVLGASVLEIIGMLSIKFLKPVLIAFILSIPIAWYFMSGWLEDFAYRTKLSPFIFFSAGALALIIAWFTMSFHSIRAANSNPIESLKDE